MHTGWNRTVFKLELKIFATLSFFQRDERTKNRKSNAREAPALARRREHFFPKHTLQKYKRPNGQLTVRAFAVGGGAV
ncbi:MAG: hypothetical protein D6714_15150 [Bacteroidetes bacterium]|nr:MAG: hypothetical protein D6714_15150 [Bacteroidota bacterium]